MSGSSAIRDRKPKATDVAVNESAILEVSRPQLIGQLQEHWGSRCFSCCLTILKCFSLLVKSGSSDSSQLVEEGVQ